MTRLTEITVERGGTLYRAVYAIADGVMTVQSGAFGSRAAPLAAHAEWPELLAALLLDQMISEDAAKRGK